MRSQLVFAFAPNCTLLKVHTWGVESSYLRCELSTIPQSVFRACFLFPWLPLANCSIPRLFGFALLKLSSMVGLSNERHKKLISERTSAWDLGTRFSKVTFFHDFTIHNLFTTKFIKIQKLLKKKYCIKLHYSLYKSSRKERGNNWIADWAQKIQCLEICAQSEARTQMGSWTSPLKVSSQVMLHSLQFSVVK